MNRILTVEQAAEKLQVRPNTVRSWLKHGKIPGRKIGRIYRISESDLDVFLHHIDVGPENPATDDLAERIDAIMGKYAGLISSVDAFLEQKRKEADIEERRKPA